MEFRKFEMNDREFEALLRANKASGRGGRGRKKKVRPIVEWLDSLNLPSDPPDMPTVFRSVTGESGKVCVPGRGVSLDDLEADLKKQRREFINHWNEQNGYEQFPYFISILRMDNRGEVLLRVTSYDPTVATVG